eukprot:gene34216-41416_t
MLISSWLFILCCLLALSHVSGQGDLIKVSSLVEAAAKIVGEDTADLPLPPLENLLPPLWDQVPPLDSEHFSVNAEGALVVQAWDYLHRMALYRHMLTHTPHCLWSPHSTPSPLSRDVPAMPGNILWGLALQHGWQMSSGRLFLLPNSTMMSADGWWAQMNFYLSAVPYLAAVEARIAPAVEIAGWLPEGFCRQASECADLVEVWATVFREIRSTKDNCTAATTDNTASIMASLPPTPYFSSLNYHLSYLAERLLSSLWEAHLQSIATATPLAQQAFEALPARERKFGGGWVELVGLVGASLLPCNLSTTSFLQYTLPTRVLDSDSLGQLPPLQRRTVLFLSALTVLTHASGGAVQRWWTKGMCTEDGRAQGRAVLIGGIYRPVLVLQGVKEIEEIVRNTPEGQECGVVPPE